MVDWSDFVLVGRVGKPHGLRGHTFVNAETDFVEERFAPGGTVWARGKGKTGEEALTIASFRWQGTRPVVSFEGLDSIEAIEYLAGAELKVPEDVLRPLEDGVYYHHQLVGCEVVTESGGIVGTVARVDGGTGGSLLVVNAGSSEVLIPLAETICSQVDVTAKRIVVTPPDGLLELNEKRD